MISLLALTWVLFFHAALLPSDVTLNQDDINIVNQEDIQEDIPKKTSGTVLQPIIKKIIISGNKYVINEAILNYVPYTVGEPFDPKKTRTLIRNLYFNLKRFRTIEVLREPLADNAINLHIIVGENIAKIAPNMFESFESINNAFS